MPTLEEWLAAYTQEHGHAPGQGNDESALDAYTNRLWSEREVERIGRPLTQEDWERHYWQHQRRNTPEWQRDQAAAARDLAAQYAERAAPSSGSSSPRGSAAPPGVDYASSLGRGLDQLGTNLDVARRGIDMATDLFAGPRRSRQMGPGGMVNFFDTRLRQADQIMDWLGFSNRPRISAPGDPGTVGFDRGANPERGALYDNPYPWSLDTFFSQIPGLAKQRGWEKNEKWDRPYGLQNAWQMPFEGDYRMTQEFGVNPDAYRRFGIAGHAGVDWALPMGTPVRPAAPGRIVEIGNDPSGFGQFIKVRHDDGSTTQYSHLSPGTATKRVGDRVDWTDTLALSGNTGNSTGPHLDFGYLPASGAPPGYAGYADPMALFSRRDQLPPPDNEYPAAPTYPFADLIAETALLYDLPPEILAGLFQQESTFNPAATSYAGAQGLGQIMPTTGQWIAQQRGMNPAQLDLYNPATNADFSGWYLDYLLDYFGGDMDRAIMAYHDGPGNVRRGRISSLAQNTYLPNIYQYAQSYGYAP